MNDVEHKDFIGYYRNLYPIGYCEHLIKEFNRFEENGVGSNRQKSEDVKFLALSGNELMRRTIGHVQLSLTILEFIGLEKEIKNGFLKLKEPRSGLKDRAVSTEMANYLFQLLELNMVKKQQESEFDLSDFIIIV